MEILLGENKEEDYEIPKGLQGRTKESGQQLQLSFLFSLPLSVSFILRGLSVKRKEHQSPRIDSDKRPTEADPTEERKCSCGWT